MNDSTELKEEELLGMDLPIIELAQVRYTLVVLSPMLASGQQRK